MNSPSSAPVPRPVIGKHFTWGAIVLGVGSALTAVVETAPHLVNAVGPLTALLGSGIATKIVAGCVIISLVSTPVAGAGKSVGPRSVNPPSPPADPA